MIVADIIIPVFWRCCSLRFRFGVGRWGSRRCGRLRCRCGRCTRSCSSCRFGGWSRGYMRCSLCLDQLSLRHWGRWMWLCWGWCRFGSRRHRYHLWLLCRCGRSVGALRDNLVGCFSRSVWGSDWGRVLLRRLILSRKLFVVSSL